MQVDERPVVDQEPENQTLVEQVQVEAGELRVQALVLLLEQPLVAHLQQAG